MAGHAIPVSMSIAEFEERGRPFEKLAAKPCGSDVLTTSSQDTVLFVRFTHWKMVFGVVDCGFAALLLAGSV